MSDIAASPANPPGHETSWGVKILGWVCVLFGAVILAGGVWLILLGGSWYYGLAGLGLAATGILLNRYMMEAVWLYLVVWVGTVAWAWWEVGTNWWAEVPRLVAPTLILVLVLLCIPALRRHPSKL
ncbi:glucose dehydrogenase [Oceanicola sp. 22II-s10i]|uniref:glucose dehydrogenase n=1 Tax=Oceanicola sp. 22II-s10i TaxID=1317116 RepID=UPI000B5274A7|nr:glucose dehydrogenase [Oceanicola sp. 22II-s10i]OWU84082.1 glucose dehydrogenase [Oceanicola sp. 22II-s10i]